MKKVVLIGLVLFLGLSSQAFAKAGNAKDGPEFVLALVCFLLLLAGILKGIDYLMKNGKGIFHRVKEYLKKKVITLSVFFNKFTFKYFDMPIF